MVWAKNDNTLRVLDVANRTDTPGRPHRGLCAHEEMPQTPPSQYEAGSLKSFPLCADSDVVYLAEAPRRTPLSFFGEGDSVEILFPSLSPLVFYPVSNDVAM